MKRIIIIFGVLLMSAAGASAQSVQSDRADVRRGNRDFRKENFREAEIDYRKALVKDSLSVAANYNLANTLYREGDMENASKALERIKDVAPASASAADYYFNQGDVAIAQQNWQTAVDAFQQSLLRNPGDLQAKENYIYAKKKLQDQQNQQNQNNDQNQDNQDQNNDQNQNDQQNDQQNDDKNDQNKDDQQKQQDQNNQDQQEQEQPQQGRQPKITPQAAQQMLQAIQAKEKETQDKVNRQKAEALKSRQKDKNW